MSRWLTEGLLTHKPTTAYPARPESTAGISPGLPVPSSELTGQALEQLVSMCRVGALSKEKNTLGFDDGRCIHCMRCKGKSPKELEWDDSYEWARLTKLGEKNLAKLSASFKASLYIRTIDAGACAACLTEISLLAGPNYNMHRLGFFMTPTPRKADVLLVSGPVTDHMRDHLLEAYDSMPEPKRVIAVGACAMTGGVFGPSFTCAAGLSDMIPVDVVVPGCPPPPLALLHALLVLTGRKQQAEKIRALGSDRS